MAALRIEPADDTPLVHFDSDKETFLISGKSLPEDVISFYGPVLEWLKVYQNSPLDKTVFDFKLIYFNTASSKLILDILLTLEEIKEAGKEVLIRWHSVENDEDMEEAGEEYSEMVDLPFEYHTFEM